MEIKFRAWNKPGELMTYSGEHETKDIDGNDRQYWVYLVPSVNAGKIYEVTLLDNGSLEKEQYEGILMQDTGLKDKNGVKIYEGDILAQATRVGSRAEQPRHTVTRDVYQAIGQSRFSLPTPLYTFKIVGNIHEGDNAS